jgi:hypothetical protein
MAAAVFLLLEPYGAPGQPGGLFPEGAKRRAAGNKISPTSGEAKQGPVKMHISSLALAFGLRMANPGGLSPDCNHQLTLFHSPIFGNWFYTFTVWGFRVDANLSGSA